MVNAKTSTLKLAEIGRFLSKIAGIVYRKERINCCVFTIICQYTDQLLQCKSNTYIIKYLVKLLCYNLFKVEKHPSAIKMRALGYGEYRDDVSLQAAVKTPVPLYHARHRPKGTPSPR